MREVESTCEHYVMLRSRVQAELRGRARGGHPNFTPYRRARARSCCSTRTSIALSCSASSSMNDGGVYIVPIKSLVHTPLYSFTVISDRIFTHVPFFMNRVPIPIRHLALRVVYHRPNQTSIQAQMQRDPLGLTFCSQLTSHLRCASKLTFSLDRWSD